ncbi:hypothetical protein JCM18918_902 [Cutibacterium acnes JCM 18918]|nr:hypothetical protein JCM18918_902 [Cutibacterium acnes JCM 18918]
MGQRWGGAGHRRSGDQGHTTKKRPPSQRISGRFVDTSGQLVFVLGHHSPFARSRGRSA